jgi:hypothetical protein
MKRVAVADAFYAVRVATFAYDRPVTQAEIDAIALGQAEAPAQAVLAVGAVVRDAGTGNGPARGVYVLAGDEYEAISEPGTLYQTPTDSTHVVYVEDRYLQSTTAPVAQAPAAQVPDGSSGTVPVSSDPFGLGSLVDPTVKAATPSPDWIPAIVTGVIIALIVSHLEKKL